MPSAAEVELMLRPHWKWAAPVIARAIRSRKDVPGYADNRHTSARDMAQDIVRRYGKPLASVRSDALLFLNSNEFMRPPDDNI